VLDNCICNAVSYSPAGTEVAISVRRVNHEILVSITDQGIGIPEEDLPYVFDRMFRARRRQMPGGGVGLGLAISKGLVEAHGGRIWIESEEGQGCRCFFTIPQQVKPEKGDG
jgi:two-component system sensor histidine kinase VicK